MTRWYPSIALTLCLVLFAAVSHASNAQWPNDADKVDFQWGVKIPLRDGVRLNATVYTPKDQNTPAPCIFTLTPYISQGYHDRGVYFATHGLPFLTVDVRGRGNSEGQFRPNIQEARDGYDVVEWLARQPYCNGKVAMWGGSYAGHNQWAAAKEFPPHLATIVPVASPYMGVDFPMRNNIGYPYLIQWLTLTSGRTSQKGIFADHPFWVSHYRRWFESGRPLNELDSILGNPSPIFQEWLAHPHPDAYWDAYNPTPEQYARMRIPVLTITGIYDGDQRGALAHYRQYMRNASDAGQRRHYLIIGPWDHAGTRTPKAQAGGVNFGPASLVDLPKLHLQWYAWTMQGGPKPSFLQNRVAYYVTGTEKWRYADTLEQVTARVEPYYLDAAHNPTDVFAAGTLASETPGQGQPDHYVYDPRDTSMAAVQEKLDPSAWVVDQTLTHAMRGRQLVYHTAPFGQDTEVSGFFRLSAWIAIDQPDTDFMVSVYDIDSEGRSTLLTNDLLRARYRENVREPQLVQTRKPLRYEFNQFPFVSRLIRQGHRLRLVISPIDTIYLEKNYNSGGVVAEESIKDARPVTVTLYHDSRHPSALYVPVGRPALPNEPGAPAEWFTTPPNGAH